MKKCAGRHVTGVMIPLTIAAMAVATLGCQPAPAPLNPEDPEIVAAIEKAMAPVMEGAAAANAEQALSAAAKDQDFTFIAGDTMIVGYDQALATFRDTYSTVQKQTSDVVSSRVRVLAPDVVLVTAITQGTYTDIGGFTSEPIGLGSTIVFVRRNGEWQAVHYHQSVAK